MATEQFHSKIDESQKSLAEKEKIAPGSDTKTLSDYQKQIFFQQIDHFQTLEPTSEKGKKYYEEQQKVVLADLLQAGEIGRKALQEKQEKQLEGLDSLAHQLETKLSEYRKNLLAITDAEKDARTLTEKTIQITQNLEGKILSPEQLQAILPEVVANIGQASLVKQKYISNNVLQEVLGSEYEASIDQNLNCLKVWKTLGDMQENLPEEFRDFVELIVKNGQPEWKVDSEKCKQKNQNPEEIVSQLQAAGVFAEARLSLWIEAKSAPTILNNYYEGMMRAENGEVELSIQLLKKFCEEDSKSQEFSNNHYLASRKENFMKSAQETLVSLEKIKETHKKFFEAENAYKSADFYNAKKLFVEYLKQPVTDKDEQSLNFQQAAKEYLQKILNWQIDQAELKLLPVMAEKEAEYRENIGGGGTEGAPGYSLEEFRQNQEYYPYYKALQEMRSAIQAGGPDLPLTFEEIYEQYAAANKLDPNARFNFLADEITRDNGRAGLLKLAEKYQKTGQYSLAEQCYMEFFEAKIRETSSEVTPQKVKETYMAKKGFQEGIEKSLQASKELYEKQSHEFKDAHPWTADYEQKVRQSLIDQAISGVYELEVQKAQQRKFNVNPENLGSPEEQQAWKKFANMKGIHGVDKFWEPLAMSDAELDEFIKNRAIDVALLALTIPTGGGSAAVAAGRMVARAGVGAIGRIAELGMGSARIGLRGVELLGSGTARLGKGALQLATKIKPKLGFNTFVGMSGIAHAAFIYRKEIAQKIKKSAEIVKRTGFSSRLLLASKDYINPEYHELSRKYKAQLDAEKKAIAERDKLMSPDETKALEYEDKVKEDIEAGKEIKFEDVIFADEKFTEGVPEEIAQKAKENLDQSVYKLEEEKKKETNPDRPSPQMLQKIITELTPGPAYEKTQSKALVSLATRGPEVQNQNCNARAKIIVMALERLYPKLKGKIYQQEFDDHVRILFNIDGDVVTGETYVMEEGVSLLSQSPDKDKASEINKYEDIIKKNYGGKQTPPPISVGQVDEQKDKPYPGNTDQKSGKLSGKSGKKLGNYSNVESMMDPKLMASSDPEKNPTARIQEVTEQVRKENENRKKPFEVELLTPEEMAKVLKDKSRLKDAKIALNPVTNRWDYLTPKGEWIEAGIDALVFSNAANTSAKGKYMVAELEAGYVLASPDRNTLLAGGEIFESVTNGGLGTIIVLQKNGTYKFLDYSGNPLFGNRSFRKAQPFDVDGFAKISMFGMGVNRNISYIDRQGNFYSLIDVNDPKRHNLVKVTPQNY